MNQRGRWFTVSTVAGCEQRKSIPRIAIKIDFAAAAAAEIYMESEFACSVWFSVSVCLGLVNGAAAVTLSGGQ